MRILLFAHLKDAAGGPMIELDAPRALTVDELWQQLIAACPALAAHRHVARVACNCEYTPPDARFSNADELALIPPVSGG